MPRAQQTEQERKTDALPPQASKRESSTLRSTRSATNSSSSTRSSSSSRGRARQRETSCDSSQDPCTTRAAATAVAVAGDQFRSHSPDVSAPRLSTRRSARAKNTAADPSALSAAHDAPPTASNASTSTSEMTGRALRRLGNVPRSAEMEAVKDGDGAAKLGISQAEGQAVGERVEGDEETPAECKQS